MTKSSRSEEVTLKIHNGGPPRSATVTIRFRKGAGEATISLRSESGSGLSDYVSETSYSTDKTGIQALIEKLVEAKGEM